MGQQELPAEASGQSAHHRRWLRPTLTGLGVLLAFVVGVGAGPSPVDPETTEEYLALEAELEQVALDRDEAREAADEVGAELEEATQAWADQQSAIVERERDLDALEASLGEQRADLDSQRADLEVALAVVADREAEVTRAEATVAAAAATQQRSAAAPAPAPAPVVEYRNCAAARAAGAAPVYRGDPGYGPHLDRDNDGIGCE